MKRVVGHVGTKKEMASALCNEQCDSEPKSSPREGRCPRTVSECFLTLLLGLLGI
ncbi:hypothetical protein [Porphyromonas circumdentaria]|uniref:hypothetical protein n=1 Tax=Porphyromonas circumdentaria TaxID=29524 RepID=UPI0013564352|nr:hypothetical protein [Porphyromonas circumdentaria]MBB6275431.1 hypothetical protein [Porphyromonas circumdentaria]MDO4722126.1 hypothetical protein [Porphyromonas circumdentaria]